MTTELENKDAIGLIDHRFTTKFNLSDSQLGSSSDNLHSEVSVLKDPIRWTKLRKISNQLFSEHVVGKYGEPTCLLTKAVIAIGTTKGFVLIFDYHQNIKFVVGEQTKASQCGEVTALAISDDLAHIASGHSNGHIFTWELTKPKHYIIHIYPQPRGKKLKSDGHLFGSPVIHLNFLRKRHSALVSGDADGMAFVHNVTMSLIGRLVNTQKLMGKYPPPFEPKTANTKPSTLFACELLPSNRHEVDLVAVLTPNLLALITLDVVPNTQFKTGRPKSVTNNMGLSGCLSWYRASRKSEPLLAYCWSNVLTVIQVHTAISKDNNMTITPHSPKRYVSEEAFVSVQWMSDKIIALVTITQYLVLVNYETMSVSTTVDLTDKHIMHYDYFSRPLEGLNFKDNITGELSPIIPADAFYNSIKASNGKLFLMGEFEFVAGSISNWADKLLIAMEQGDYNKAIELGISYYQGTYDSAVVDLPEDDGERHLLVMKNLPEMIVASILYTFKNQDKSEEEQKFDQKLQVLTKTALEAWLIIGTEEYLLEQIYSLYQQYKKFGILFIELANIASNRSPKLLIPTSVFSDVLKTAAPTPEYRERLEYLICFVDPKSLDLDHTVAVCKKYKLRDSLIYIWNIAFNDYIMPFVEFFDLIKNGETDQASKIYPYISYILTDRVYPSGELSTNSAKSRNYVYFFIFRKSFIAWPQQQGKIIKPSLDELNVYPYLHALVEFDSAAFFSALNEAFESPCLNSIEPSAKEEMDPAVIFGNELVRQDIIDILLNCEFKDEDKIYLDIFLARNYPKYTQFIKISDERLDSILLNLCNSQSQLREDCSLGLMAMFSVYKPKNKEILVPKLLAARLIEPLRHLYQSENDYVSLINLNLDINIPAVMESVSEGLKNETARPSVIELVQEKFQELVKINPQKMERLLNRYDPELYSNLSNLSQELEK